MRSFIVINLALSISFIEAAPVDLSPPQNALGAADENGHVRYVHRFGDVKFSDGFSIPLRFDFSSERLANGVESDFGWHGWGCGAIESKADLIKDRRFLKIQLLCAKTMLLKQSENDPDQYFTGDKSWEGRVEEETISVWRDDGWNLSFRKGKVDHLTTDEGREISWNRDGQGRVISIQEEGTAEPQLVLKWGENGKPNEVDIRNRIYRFHFKGDTLAALEWKGIEGEARRFRIKQGENSLQLDTPRFRHYYFSWSLKSGILLSDGVNRYRLKEQQGKGGDSVRRTLEMVEPDGASTSLVLGESGGETRYMAADGKVITVTKIVEAGPAYGAVKEVQLSVDGETKKRLLMKNVFDQDGKITQRLWRGNPARFSGYHSGTIENALLPRPDQEYEMENYEKGSEAYVIDFVYREDGQLRQVMVNRSEVLGFVFDERGRIAKMNFKDRYEKQFAYQENGEQTERLLLKEAKTGPFWFLESESKDVDSNLVVSSTVSGDGLLLSQEFADGRTMKVEYDKKLRRVRDITLAPDGKKEIKSVSYVYSPGELKVLRITENLIRKDITYAEITSAGVGKDVQGRLLPKELAVTKNPGL